ncbi:hypothetical protein ACWDR1_07115 [Streptosporangium sandarakinum]
MKRVVTGVLVTAVAALGTAAPARAAAHALAAQNDPVKALKSQFAPGKGVKFTDLTTMIEDGKGEPYLKRSGSFQFGRAGIVASDISSDRAVPLEDPTANPNGVFGPARTIRVGAISYARGGSYSDKMPSGKSWYKDKSGMTGDVSGWFSQLVNVAEPQTLATLLKGAKKSGRGYSGTTTFGRLAKVSPWFRATLPLRSSDKTVVTFKLTLGRHDLPQRLTTSFSAGGIFDTPYWESRTISVETRYTGWGSRVSIKAPPASKVTTKLEDHDGI